MFHPFKTIALATSLLTFSLFSGSTPLAAQSTDQLLTPRTFIDVSKKVLPAVVSIQVENLPSKELMERYDVETFEELQRKLQQNNDLDAFAELWRNFEPGMFGSSGSGSGVVVRRDGNVGYIVTNKHVLSTSDRVYYTLIFDESISEERVKVKGEDVTIVGMDELTDLAVIKFNIPEG
ncbi:MAG: trypsin-like peptidase domain-containing protein, partial [Candidatus Sumerlaeia bacterium]|nr:trypsin-like peptidase domain-containing protein [Candidatus Sumerlaeia bacterium]